VLRRHVSPHRIKSYPNETMRRLLEHELDLFHEQREMLKGFIEGWTETRG